jgi:hypothetical protein
MNQYEPPFFREVRLLRKAGAPGMYRVQLPVAASYEYTTFRFCTAASACAGAMSFPGHAIRFAPGRIGSELPDGDVGVAPAAASVGVAEGEFVAVGTPGPVVGVRVGVFVGGTGVAVLPPLLGGWVGVLVGVLVAAGCVGVFWPPPAGVVGILVGVFAGVGVRVGVLVAAGGVFVGVLVGEPPPTAP